MDAAIAKKLGELDDNKKKLAAWAMKVGLDYERAAGTGRPVNLALRAQYTLADRLIYRKLKAAIGLDHARFCVSGAAPIAPEVIERFAGLGLPIYEVYGQSEDAGPTSICMPRALKFGTVGKPLPGVDVRIADDGEIMVRGPNVFAGYMKEPAATAEALEDGWLHSGDLGKLDADGFLQITGRKKEIIITAGGKNIAPKNIEAALKEHPLVGEAVVIGDRRKYLVALLTLEPDAAAHKAKELGVEASALPEHAEVRRELAALVDRVNRDLARVEQIKKFRVLPRAFGIDTGELTPTLKVKRRVVNQLWSAEIEALYDGGEAE
jgi:long-chain acyl-CoA synthetase